MHSTARRVCTQHAIRLNQTQLTRIVVYIYCRTCKPNHAHGRRAFTPQLLSPSQMVKHISRKDSAKVRSSPNNAAQVGLVTILSFYWQDWGKQWQNSA